MYGDQPVLPLTDLYIPLGSVVGLAVGILLLYDAIVWIIGRCCCCRKERDEVNKEPVPRI